MSERSVAEILGWQRVGYATGDGVAQCWTKPLDGEPEPAPPYTVDDLLAWLRDRVYDIEMTYQAVGYMVELRRAEDSGSRPEYLYAPTLLAALEAAVRAVAGES